MASRYLNYHNRTLGIPLTQDLFSMCVTRLYDMLVFSVQPSCSTSHDFLVVSGNVVDQAE